MARKPPPQPPGPSPTRRFTDEANIETVIGRGVKIEGQVDGRTNIELFGQIQGTCVLEGLLVVRTEGTFRGDITATSLVVEGKVHGNVIAREKVELRPSCQVTGNIEASSVAIAEGSFFEGEVHMKGQEGGQARVSFQEKRASPQRLSEGTEKGFRRP